MKQPSTHSGVCVAKRDVMSYANIGRTFLICYLCNSIHTPLSNAGPICYWLELLDKNICFWYCRKWLCWCNIGLVLRIIQYLYSITQNQITFTDLIIINCKYITYTTQTITFVSLPIKRFSWVTATTLVADTVTHQNLYHCHNAY